MLAVFQIAFHDVGERRIIEKPMRQGIQKRRKVTNARAPDQSSGTENSADFTQAGEAVVSFDEVIERSKKE